MLSVVNKITIGATGFVEIYFSFYCATEKLRPLNNSYIYKSFFLAEIPSNAPHVKGVG